MIPYEHVSTEIPNAARSGPNRSMGSAYRLPEIHTSTKKLALTANAARVRVGTSGISAVSVSSAAAIQHTRNRAAIGFIPPRIRRNATHPPKNPPSPANNGGIHANWRFAASSCIFHSFTKYSVVELVHSVYRAMIKKVANTSPHKIGRAHV